MTRAAEIIQALNARERGRVPLERSTGLPYGWALWMKAVRAVPTGSVVRPDEVVALLAARPPAPWPRGEELDRWQALLALFRQGWLPAPRDERPLRAVAWTGSAALHVLFVVLLAWISYLQSLLPPPRQAGGGGGDRIGVGFVERGEGAAGSGTPERQAEPGAADGDVQRPASRQASRTNPTTRQTARATPATVQPAEAAAEEEAAFDVPPVAAITPVEVDVPQRPAPAMPEGRGREVPMPEPEVDVTGVPAPQVPVAVREVAMPGPRLQVPEREVAVVQAPAIQAPRPREVDVPLPVAREPELRQREVTVVEAPVVPAATATRPVEARAPEARLPELRQREVSEPLPPVAVAPPQVPARQLEPRPRPVEPTLRQREIGMPAAPASAAATPDSGPAEPAATPPTVHPAPASQPSPRAAPSAVAGAPRPAPPGAGQASGASARQAGQPGSDPWANTMADDRWGPPAREGARAPGLFDAEGRARLPGDGAGQGSGPGQGVAERGAPGGDSDTWTRERIEQSGTWLKRPPYDHQPTSFDRYWVPNESLLAEWVRKGIKSVAIPIPGTNGKRINCVVSLLQLGGGCGISDPNLNEQAAEARPPPEVPFKPELQEDNGSVRP
ncbi:hypothetical protein CSC68_07265 [Pseudoxanthomonas suwonensis]|nr:hypothetical protein CSC68_07265 [Pseudoxanthomonas suwonensis]